MICNSLHFNIFGQKSIPGGVIALDLLHAVFNPWTWPRGPGCQETREVEEERKDLIVL